MFQSVRKTIPTYSDVLCTSALNCNREGEATVELCKKTSDCLKFPGSDFILSDVGTLRLSLIFLCCLRWKLNILWTVFKGHSDCQVKTKPLSTSFQVVSWKWQTLKSESKCHFHLSLENKRDCGYRRSGNDFFFYFCLGWLLNAVVKDSVWVEEPVEGVARLLEALCGFEGDSVSASQKPAELNS